MATTTMTTTKMQMQMQMLILTLILEKKKMRRMEMDEEVQLLRVKQAVPAPLYDDRPQLRPLRQRRGPPRPPQMPPLLLQLAWASLDASRAARPLALDASCTGSDLCHCGPEQLCPHPHPRP